LGDIINNKKAYLAYFAQALNIGAGILLLPLVLRYFTAEEVRLWFVFITLGGLAQLFEFGFYPTLVRNVAYVYSGAQNLYKDKLPEFDCKQVNHFLLIALAQSARIVYRFIAIISLAFMLVAGSIYINTLVVSDELRYSNLVAWLLFSAGFAVNFYYGFANGIIFGRGDVDTYYYSVIITKSTFILVTAIFILFDLGLLSLGLASLISSIIGRFFSVSNLGIKIQNGYTKEIQVLSRELKQVLVHNSLRQGVAQFSGYFAVRGSILIASSYLSIDQSASYALTLTLFIVLSTVSTTVFQMQIPSIIDLQADGNNMGSARLLGRSILVIYLLFTFGFILIAVLGHHFMVALGGKVSILDPPYLIFIGVVMLLEMNHGIFAYMLTTFNKVPFFFSSILTGFAVPLLSVFLVQHFGLWGIVFSQFFVQAMYNNWKWPREGLNKLDISFYSLLRLGYNSFIVKPKV